MLATTHNHHRFAHTALRLLIAFSVTLVNIHNLCDALQLLRRLVICKHTNTHSLQYCAVVICTPPRPVARGNSLLFLYFPPFLILFQMNDRTSRATWDAAWGAARPQSGAQSPVHCREHCPLCAVVWHSLYSDHCPLWPSAKRKMELKTL